MPELTPVPTIGPVVIWLTALARRAVRSSTMVITVRSETLSVDLHAVGAAVHRIRVLGPSRTWDDVHLHLATPDERLDRSRNPHLGSTVGRYANRIAGARFLLDGQPVQLAPNEGPNQLHGGPDGFDRRTWDVMETSPSCVTFGLTSPAGDQGYPGTLRALATYEVLGDHLTITYAATTDAPTVVNLCHHSYWNLDLADSSGEPGPLASLITDHVLTVAAALVLPVDGAGLPAGGLRPVADSPFDLRYPAALGPVVTAIPGGLDHSYAVDGTPGTLRFAARLESLASGRWLNVETDQAALHVYTGNHLRSPFAPLQAVSLEAQRFPDTPNRPDLGSARLGPGEIYRSLTRLGFGRG